MDVVPPAGAVCARLGSEAKKRADTATMLAVITNAKRWPVKPDFDGMVDSSLSDTRQHSVDLANELVQRTVGERPVIVVNFISSYSSQFTSVNRATGRPVAPSTSFMVMPRPSCKLFRAPSMRERSTPNVCRKTRSSAQRACPCEGGGASTMVFVVGIAP